MLLQSISYVHHLQDRSKQQVQPLTLQASVYCTSGTNWVTKGLRLVAFCSFIFASCLPQFFWQYVSFRSEGIYARKKSCATQQLDAVGFAKFEKWCLLLKGSSCASSLPAQLFSRCLSEQRARTRDLQAWCAEATPPRRPLDHERYLLMFKKIPSIVQLN